jgi:hypothetical protein
MYMNMYIFILKILPDFGSHSGVAAITVTIHLFETVETN